MNYLLKSIANFQFPYSLQDEPTLRTPLWEVHLATRKSDALPVTVFAHSDLNNTVSRPLVQNAVQKSKTLKLPGLVRVLEVIDSDPNTVYIVTERVQPLFPENVGGLKESALALGMYQICSTLRVLHDHASVVLGNLSKGSIYLNELGEWCLFGLELCSAKGDVSDIKSKLDAYNSLMKNTIHQLVPTESSQIDSVHLAALIKDIYSFRVPASWQPLIERLSQGRITISQFLLKANTTKTFQTPLIKVYEHLKETHIKDAEGKLVCMAEVHQLLMNNPGLLVGCAPGFVDRFIVPQLSEIAKEQIASQQLQKSGFHDPSNLITLVATALELSCSEHPNIQLTSTFDNYIKPLIFETYKLSDRQLRFLLLIYLPGYISKLSKKDFQNQIFTYFIQGLADSEPLLRLQTLKKLSYAVDMITERQLNNELLRCLAKTQVDQDVDIRTWTILKISEISEKMSGSERSNILAVAFTKSLKDPAVTPRLAAVYGLMKAIDLFDAETIANKILTVIAPGLLDSNMQVRTQARELFEVYFKKLEAESSVTDKQTKNQSEYVEVNFESMLDATDDDLVNNFLNNLKISTVPSELSVRSPTVPSSSADNDGWNDFSFDTDQDNTGGNQNKSTHLMTGKVNLKSSVSSFKNSKLESNNGLASNTPKKPNFGAVKIQKSWNDELSESEGDYDDSWNEPKVPKKLITKTIKNKKQILNSIRVSTQSVKSVQRKKEPVLSTFTNHNDDGGDDSDGWDNEW
ncbi:COPI-interacting protein CEX1 Ecym_5421 [Eremothecium cymbalariae DBVPG|uniref:Phosphatase PP2A regulatory subunit A/Splicing factor 3B subunit 1-like HEAT repeat domain-containing protein n=1 Tax=Eremothecium cymbalariae (strain CBS 270.75 / DBVPG 7215 / KCTC 17166 / NRRL Y-17582) TaxID=931890 RepID=I6NDN3_ERECY|nr:hypothetical protein Ecym_5421 [Eremothecium cymbalariae DBVPG\